jgi:hypothetical protein
MSLIKQHLLELFFYLGIPNGKLRPDDPFNRERKVTQRSSPNKNCLELCKQYVKVNLPTIKSIGVNFLFFSSVLGHGFTKIPNLTTVPRKKGGGGLKKMKSTFAL